MEFTIKKDATLTITESTIHRNIAGTNKNGGGIDNRGLLILEKSTISNNVSAQDGGGLYASGGRQDTRVSNSTFYNNQSSRHGGAILINSGNAVLDHLTIFKNKANASI